MKGWRVGSGLVTMCDDSPRMRAAWPWPRVRRAVLRGSAWLELAGGVGEVDDAGTAVVCLQPPRVRDAPRMIGAVGGFMVVLVVVASTLDAIWPPLLWLCALALAALCGRVGWNTWTERAVRRRLDEAKPPDAWYLHNFARHPDHKGAGWVLLARVLDRADARGCTIYLDTVVPRLVEFYAAAGFEVVAAVPATYAGENVVVTRMVRPPRGGL